MWGLCLGSCLDCHLVEPPPATLAAIAIKWGDPAGEQGTLNIDNNNINLYLYMYINFFLCIHNFHPLF